MKIFVAKIKREDDRAWNDVGLTVFVKDDGKVSIKDARTGEWYQCFEPKKREDSGQSAPQQNAQPAQDHDGDFPF